MVPMHCAFTSFSFFFSIFIHAWKPEGIMMCILVQGLPLRTVYIIPCFAGYKHRHVFGICFTSVHLRRLDMQFIISGQPFWIYYLFIRHRGPSRRGMLWIIIYGDLFLLFFVYNISKMDTSSESFRMLSLSLLPC